MISGNTGDTLEFNQTFDPAPPPGTRYVITTSGLPNPSAAVHSKVVAVAYSRDGGATFKPLKILDSGQGVDYPAIATGPGHEAGFRTVWVAWRAANGSIMASGVPVTGPETFGDFSAPRAVPGSNGMALPRVQVGPRGQVMVSFHTWNTGTNPTSIYVNVDDDGLGPNPCRNNPTPNPAIPSNVVFVDVGNPSIPAQADRGITPQVSLAWDWSGRFGQPGQGRVYMAYTHSFQGINHPDTDVLVRWSDDSGVNWSDWKAVHPLDLNSQFHPSIAVDQITGNVAVVWLDASNDIGNARVELHGTVSSDGGATCAPREKIAAGQSIAQYANKHQRGMSPENSTASTLSITDQNGVPNDYWKGHYWARITGTGATPEPTRNVIGSNATQLTVRDWDPDPIPQAGASYLIEGAVAKNSDGDDIRRIYRFDFGDYTGLAFHDGVFYPIWADNSNSDNRNPNGAGRALDVYTSSVWVLLLDSGDSLTSGASTSTRTGTVRLGRRSFTAVPSTSLLEAALVLGAQRTFPGPAPTGPAFDRFVQDASARVQRLGALRAADPASPAALLLGGSRPRPVPSLQALDLFFRAAWADGVLTRDDALRTLGS